MGLERGVTKRGIMGLCCGEGTQWGFVDGKGRWFFEDTMTLGWDNGGYKGVRGRDGGIPKMGFGGISKRGLGARGFFDSAIALFGREGYHQRV